MKVLVFAKQIPDINQIKFDPETNTIVREGVPLQINSFDKRAVEEAVRIKETLGWETGVATMGPPQAREILNDSLRMGIDRAYLITDRAFGGSDTLVTSRILAEVVRHIKPDLVLMGKYSLDGETSQVPPEVAVMSGYSFKSSISKIQIEDGNKACIVQHENEHGLTDYRIKLPAVLSVSEKINRARRPDDNVPQMYDQIEVLDSASLNVDIVGKRDSPTVVTGTEKIESGREVEFLDYSDSVFETIIEVIEREDAESSEDSITAGNLEKDRDSIWGIALDDPDTSLEIAAKITAIAGENSLNAVMAGNINPDKLAGMSSSLYYHIDEDESDAFAAELIKLIESEKPIHIVFPSTVMGREVAAAIAARLGLGLTADCIDLQVRDGQLIQYKPAFGGGIVASIISKTTPKMATVRPGMFRLRKSYGKFNVRKVEASAKSGVEKLGFEPVPTDFKPLRDSDTVLGVGKGLGNRNGMKAVLDLASRLSASVGGTRPVVDMRWMPRQQQVGITGFSISPRTYLSLGVSGQDNHVVGIRYAKKIIAVNTDRDAPIFRYADIGVIADANDFVSGFIKFLENRN